MMNRFKIEISQSLARLTPEPERQPLVWSSYLGFFHIWSKGVELEKTYW